jgi:prolyl-tRNA editing enzyme YbaK/EbsC (Cys-tRNA(Pro) deacylase)
MLPKIFINGGKRGVLIEIESQTLKRILSTPEVDVAITTAS